MQPTSASAAIAAPPRWFSLRHFGAQRRPQFFQAAVTMRPPSARPPRCPPPAARAPAPPAARRLPPAHPRRPLPAACRPRRPRRPRSTPYLPPAGAERFARGGEIGTGYRTFVHSSRRFSRLRQGTGDTLHASVQVRGSRPRESRRRQCAKVGNPVPICLSSGIPTTAARLGMGCSCNGGRLDLKRMARPAFMRVLLQADGPLSRRGPFSRAQSIGGEMHPQARSSSMHACIAGSRWSSVTASAYLAGSFPRRVFTRPPATKPSSRVLLCRSSSEE